jgi:transposase-like protein
VKIKDNVVGFENPAKSVVKDALTCFIKESAQKMLITAIEAEVSEFIKQYESQTLSTGHQRVVRNGYQPERTIQTGVGSIKVKLPRVRDRAVDTEEKIIFYSNLIPKYMRRTVTLDVLLPVLYLKGISTGDFSEALTPMLGEQAKSISPSVISRLKDSWYEDYQHWQKRDLSARHYVYWWVDGIYTSIRSESEKICMLVIVGATQQGKKELVGMIDGFRESTDSWAELLMDLKNRGLKIGAKLAVGDGALGFWKAVSRIYPDTQHQRCWVHKTSNVLDKLPQSQQAKAKSMLHDIYLAATKQDAVAAFNQFINHYQLKYSKAAECLIKDKEELLTFYDFPAEHWQHIRTTNPIESTFSTIRHRTKKSRGCFSRETIIACIFKLACEAEKRWKRLYGYKRLAEVINLVKFIDGISEHEPNKNNSSSEAA